ncbi:hypothetical protein KGD87_27635 [Myxococcus sp. SDU36]|nr:DUF6484 domain-containing protein [Myxococcus sp. SDU36]WIG94293.1 hypothetical protein KGD87_27635 [Myxococcus sp. SDU36]
MDTSSPGHKRSAPSESLAERILGPQVGWVTGTSSAGGALVDYPGNPHGPLPARSAIPLDREALTRAAQLRQGAILLFENGDPGLPLLMGLIHAPSETPLLDAALEPPLDEAPMEAQVDGQRVVIEGRDEVVLRCGKASLTLRRNGQVLLRGINIRTEADEVQRIKGGKVQIN